MPSFRSMAYKPIPQIAIALINQGCFSNGVVKQAIAIHEEIESYCAQKQLEIATEEARIRQLYQEEQNDETKLSE